MAAPELSKKDLAEIQRRALKRLRDRRVGGRDEPSQEKIAQKVGYSKRHYGGIERGEAELSRDHILGLMRAYRIPVSHIYAKLSDAAREVEAEREQEARAARYAAPAHDDELGEDVPRSHAFQPLDESYDARVWWQQTDDGVLVLSWLPGTRSR